MRGITYRLTGDNRMVLQVHFACWDAKTQNLVFPLQSHDFTGNGPRTASNIENECPGGEAAVGFETRWGEHVNAIGLRCDTLKIPESHSYLAVAGDQKGRWTVTVGHPAKAAAVAAAMSGCGTGCKLLHENQAKCVAVAESPQSHAVWGITSAGTLADAASGAQAGCAKQGKGQCNIVNQKCS
jgi:hypothetical protein